MWVASPDNFFFLSFSSGASTVLKKEKKKGGKGKTTRKAYKNYLHSLHRTEDSRVYGDHTSIGFV